MEKQLLGKNKLHKENYLYIRTTTRQKWFSYLK